MNLGQAKKYPAYKPSWTEWLGDIPEDWDVCRLNRVVTCLDGKRIPLNAEQREPLKGEYPYWGANGIIDHLSQWIFDEPLVLLGEDGAPFFAPHKTVAFSISGKVWVNNHAHVLRLHGIDQGFLKHVLNITEYGDFIDGSTRDKLTQAKMNTIPVPMPPPEEQAAIVRFLDHADEQIQRYIASKERLIALLEEERQALVHQAVTRGLDPSVRLKPSGVEWLREVPEHWDIRRVKTLSKVKRGASPRPIDDPKYFDLTGEYAWVRIADVTASNHYLEETTQKLSDLGQSLSVRLEPGSLFLSIAGSVGKPIITRIKCCIHDGFVYFPDLKDNEEYLYQILSTPSPFFGLGKYGTQLNLNTDTVGGIQVAWPPLWERNHITEFLHDASRKFDEGIAGIRNQIDLMNEYRTRLIADVVTGQLDVRETASQLQEAPWAAPSRTELRNE